MSLDANTMVKAVKRAAIDAVNAQKPMGMCLGEVVSTAPLQIRVDQKMTLTKAQLILTGAVCDHTVEMTVDHTTGAALENADIAHRHMYSGTTEESGDSFSGVTERAGAGDLSHTHPYAGRKTFTVHNGLQVGEAVLLLRCDGGQKFIVLDRTEVG